MHAHGLMHGIGLDEALEWEAAEAEHDDEGPRPGGWELASIIVLAVAGTGLPILGWLVGMALVHLSDVWTERDKTIAVIAPAIVVGLVVVVSAAVGDTGILLLDLGPLAVFLVLGGPIAGLLGAAYLTVRAFVLA
jgi:hypothetical protein